MAADERPHFKALRFVISADIESGDPDGQPRYLSPLSTLSKHAKASNKPSGLFILHCPSVPLPEHKRQSARCPIMLCSWSMASGGTKDISGLLWNVFAICTRLSISMPAL